MFRYLYGGACVAALAFATAASAQTSNSIEADAAAFGAREAVIEPDLAPDGTSVLYLTPGPGPATVAIISNLVTGVSRQVVSSDGSPEKLQWCQYAGSSRVVCRMRGGVDMKQVGDVWGFSRLIALDTDGGRPKLLGQPSSSYDAYVRQNDGSIIDWLGGTSGKVLISRQYVPEEGKIQSNIVNTKDGLGVDRLDVTSLRSEAVETPRDVGGYMSDGRGNIRLMSMVESNPGGMLTGRVRYQYRTSGSRDWKALTGYQLFEDYRPLAIDAAADSLYVLKKRNGRLALYAVRLDATMAETIVAENPKVDVDGVIRVGDGGKVIGYTFAEDKRSSIYTDPQFSGLAKSLSKALPKLPLVNFLDATPDGQKLLIFAGSDSDPGRYYVFDRAKKTLAEAMFARPPLNGRTLAEVKSVTVPGAGGVNIPAYLTLPAGRDAKNLPAVVLPHGGPSARDEWGFDWLAQFLAARGYAVLQPQYRGSAGFGDAWLNENGFRNWRTSIGDITASAKWLGSQGIADPNKLAILGWSYGGYAALQSAATEPNLYKAVVAIAPVTDLALTKAEAQGFTNRRIIEREIGSGAHVAEGSPLRNAAAIRAPVLLAHGDMDSNVRIGQSQKMDAALKAAGKQSEFLTFKGLDHYLDDSRARTQLLTRVGVLLERTIGR